MSMKKILAVDQYQDNLYTINHALAGPNYYLMVAKNSIAALGLLRLEEYDLLIAPYDLMSSEGPSGRSLVVEARCVYPNIKIIVTTSSSLSANKQDLEHVLRQLTAEVGQFEHVPKPIDPN